MVSFTGVAPLLNHHAPSGESREVSARGVLSYPGSFYPHTYTKGMLRLELRIAAATAALLASWGHSLQPWPDFAWKAEGRDCLITKEGRLSAGGDEPRRECCGMAWQRLAKYNKLDATELFWHIYLTDMHS